MLPANADLIDELEKGRRAFEQALAETGDEEGSAPATNRWSALECAEHVAVAETGMLAALRSASPGASFPRRPDSLLLNAGADRAVPRESPERARPKRRFASIAEARDAFAAARARTLEFIEQCPDDLRELEARHAVVGAVSGREMVLLMAVHPLRHAAQIRELPGQSREKP